MKRNALQQLQDVMDNNREAWDAWFADIDNQIALKKIHIKESRAMIKQRPNLESQINEIIDGYQAEIVELQARKKEMM